MMGVLYLNRIIFFCCVLISFSLCAMVRPPKPLKQTIASWNSLPADVKRYALQFIASSNVYEVAETMKALNATDKGCHALMQTEQTVVMIMQRMPYIANRTSLLYRLNEWPIRKKLKDYEDAQWRKLRNGGELLDATEVNNIERVKELLTQEDLQLNCWENSTSNTSLILALDNGRIEIAVALIKAGANVENFALSRAIKQDNISLIKLLLEFGADLDIFNLKTNYPTAIGIPEIRKLFHDAQENKKKRQRSLSGKDGCAIA